MSYQIKKNNRIDFIHVLWPSIAPRRKRFSTCDENFFVLIRGAGVDMIAPSLLEGNPLTPSTLQLQTPITIRVRYVKKNAKAIYKLKIKLKENLHIQIPFLSHFLTSISSSFMAMDYVDICTLGDQVDNAQTRMVINIRESTSYATRWRLLFKHAWTKATTNTNDINFILIYLEINLNNKI